MKLKIKTINLYKKVTMKNYKFIMPIIASILMAMSACKKDDATTVTDKIQSGTWIVTVYSESGKDQLSHFAGYNFTFANGVVTAVKSGSSVSGTYSTKLDDSQKKLVLNFGAKDTFDELNDDWHVLEETSVKIRLEDVSGGNGGTDLLTFEKI